MVIAEYDLDGNCVNNYIFAGNDRIGIMRNPGENDLLLFVLKDHLGTARVVVNDSGTVMARYKYYSFAESAGSWVSQGTDYRFTGKEIDEETYYYYFGARYYDPEIGRWFSVDPVLSDFSPYAYCLNNPLSMRDIKGEFPIWLGHLVAWTIFGGAVGGGFSQSHGGSYWEGFGWGALAGAAIWGGMSISASKMMAATTKGWSGLFGKLTATGGFSMWQNMIHGRGAFDSYSFGFGPVQATFSKGEKSRLGFSATGAAAMTVHWAMGFRFNAIASLKSGSPVFVGDVEQYKKGVLGLAFGDVIAVEDTDVSVPLLEEYIQAGLAPEGSKYWLLGHERVHTIQFWLWSQALKGINQPYGSRHRFYFNFGYDAGWLGSYLLLSPFGNPWNPYEFDAYLGHTRY